MFWQDALRARLIDDPAVLAVVSTRVTWVDRPQGEGLPAITLQTIFEDRPQTHEGFDGLDVSHVQIDCWAASYTAANQAKEAAIAALTPADEGNGIRFERSFINSIRDLGERVENQFVHRASIDMVLHHGVPPPPPPPPPLALSDFKNGIYSIGGAAKAYADLWAPPPAALDLTAAGLGVDYAGAGSASGSVVGAADLFAAIQPELGMTGVLDVSVTCAPADVGVDVFLLVGARNPASSSGAGAYIEFSKFGTGDSVGNFGYPATNDNISTFPLGTFSSGFHRIAFSYSPAFQGYSMDGADTVVGLAPAANLALLEEIFLYVYVFNTPSGSSARIEKVEWRPLTVDPADIKALSAA